MNTQQLNDILGTDGGTRKLYKGTFAMDKVPPIVDGIYVVNTDCSHLPGQHWVCYYVDNSKIEFFDAYGNVTDFYIGLPEADQCNLKKLQGSRSSSCGQWCVLYLLYRSRGFTMTQIVRLFSEDLDDNDHTVVEFVNERFGLELEPHAINGLSLI
jgi:hypothetical protein